MSRNRRGFTIVEILVAVIVLSIGVLALAGTLGTITRMMSNGQQKTRAATVLGINRTTLWKKLRQYGLE